MTDITQGNEFVPQRHKQPPRLVETAQPYPTDAQISEVIGRPVASVLSDTDLQRIALLVGSLTYGDMKTLAAGVLGKEDPAEVIVLADRFHIWAEKTKVAA